MSKLILFKTLFICLIFGNLIFSQERKLSVHAVDSLLTQGNSYFKKADFENSLKTLRIMLYHAELIKNDSLSAFACNRIARNFEEISEYNKALYFYNKGLAFANKANRTDIESTIFINIGNVYGFTDFYNFNTATKNYNIAIEIADNSNDFESQFIINMNMAWLYFEAKKFDEGYKYLIFANKNFDKYGDENFFTTINMLNGIYCSSKNQNEKANEYFLIGINKSEEIVLKQDKQFLYLEYSKFLAKIGDFKNAYINQQKSLKISDELFKSTKLTKASIAGVNLEIDNYKFEVKKLEAQNQQQNKDILKSRTVNILAALMAFIFILLIYSLQKSAKSNKINNEKLTKKNIQLKTAVDKALEASMVKSQFVSTISHELRTPLYGVIGITDIIFDEHKKLINNKHLDALKFSARYLLSLINDILQISKIEESEIELDSAVFNIYKIIHDIKNALQFIATKNNVQFTINIDDKVPVQVVGDETRLTQILMNLVTNALKFTKNGDVTISLTLDKKTAEISYIKFEIKDTGIGIAVENHDKIFEKFTQIKRKDDDYQGTGLGLSIVKKLLTLFKSEISIKSELNIGSCFSFIIGFQTSTDNIENKLIVSKTSLDLKILVVEDNKINQLVTQKILQNQNQTCKIVSSGLEAIAVLKNASFDLILMDINMPELNGFETTIEIRKMNIDIPIIALTAYNRKQVTQQAKIAGIDAVLVKPFEPNKLFETIEKLLQEKNAD